MSKLPLAIANTRSNKCVRILGFGGIRYSPATLGCLLDAGWGPCPGSASQLGRCLLDHLFCSCIDCTLWSSTMKTLSLSQVSPFTQLQRHGPMYRVVRGSFHGQAASSVKSWMCHVLSYKFKVTDPKKACCHYSLIPLPDNAPCTPPVGSNRTPSSSVATSCGCTPPSPRPLCINTAKAANSTAAEPTIQQEAAMSQANRSGCHTTTPAAYASIWNRLCRLPCTPLKDPAGSGQAWLSSLGDRKIQI
jgi:hypothetical protein